MYLGMYLVHPVRTFILFGYSERIQLDNSDRAFRHPVRHSGQLGHSASS